jgi:hypothetical protein
MMMLGHYRQPNEPAVLTNINSLIVDRKLSTAEGNGEEDLSVVLEETDNAITAAEYTRAIRWLKALVLGVLVLSAAGIALVVYFYLKTSEENDFEDQFEDYATNVLGSIGKSLGLTLGAVDSMVYNVVSHVHSSDSEQTWPFVTIPDFGVRAAKVLSLSEVIFMQFYPLVSNDERKRWENYTASHNQWVRFSRKMKVWMLMHTLTSTMKLHFP